MRKIVISSKLTTFDSEVFKKYLNEVSKMPLLTASEENDLAIKAAAGDKKAEEKLINCNLRFVISVAKNYVDSTCRLEDLVNEGNEGLIIAARRFSPDTGYKFISYAVWWIRRSIIEYKSKFSRYIRVPNNKITEIGKLREFQSRFELENNREPSQEEILTSFNGLFDQDKLRDLFVINNTDIWSLDYQNSNDDTLVDILPNEDAIEADHLLIREGESSNLTKMLDVLTPNERSVITLSYGLDGGNPMTLNEIGEEINLSRERVRQLKDKALLTLKFKAKKENWGQLFNQK